MQKFFVRYHFGSEFGVTRTINAESKEDAMIEATYSKIVEFVEKDVLYRFNMEDVKYTTVKLPPRMSTLK